jgi:hypothetical protein
MSRIYMCDSTIMLIIVVGYPLSDIEVARPKIGVYSILSVPMDINLVNHSISNRTS